MSDTPLTDRVAQMCNTDSEHTDVSAYNVMYDHATQLERDRARLIKALQETTIALRGFVSDEKWEGTWHKTTLEDSSALLAEMDK